MRNIYKWSDLQQVASHFYFVVEEDDVDDGEVKEDDVNGANVEVIGAPNDDISAHNSVSPWISFKFFGKVSSFVFCFLFWEKKTQSDSV